MILLSKRLVIQNPSRALGSDENGSSHDYSKYQVVKCNKNLYVKTGQIINQSKSIRF